VYGQEEMEIYNDDSKLYINFNYGTTVSWLTRIINQNDRSNFVFRDFLPGMYLNMKLQNIPYVSPQLRFAFYYPLISTFNHVPQKANTPLHFALDFFTAACFEKDFKNLSINAGPGLHILYLRSDRWNYLNLGIAATVGIEYVLNSNVILLVDLIASLDNGNLGGNRLMEPFNTVFQYQASVGIRYIRNKNNNKNNNNPPMVNPEDNFPILIR